MSDLTPDDIFDTYGAFNDLSVGDKTPTAGRRTLSTTEAISAVLEKHYTPDVLGGKSVFDGVVMATIVSTSPILQSSQALIEYVSDSSPPDESLYYGYKVYIPEIEPRCINFSDRGAPGSFTNAQRVQTLPNATVDTSALDLKTIAPGTYVKIRFQNYEKLKNPQIIAIGKKVLNLSGALQKKGSLKSKFSKRKPTAVVGNPLQAKYKGANRDFQDVTVKNGYIEEEHSGLLTEYSRNGRTVTILADMETDLDNFAAAFEKKFSERKFYMGNSYRRYGTKTENGTQAYFYECYQQKKRGEASPCNNGNLAARPGTSNHGWGAAVDLQATRTFGAAGTNNDRFRWLNANAGTYNFVFNVRGEKWHITWTKIPTVLTGVSMKTKEPWVKVSAGYKEPMTEISTRHLKA